MPRTSLFHVIQTQSNENAQKSRINEEIIFMQCYTDTKNEKTKVKCCIDEYHKYNEVGKEADTKYILCTSVYLKFKNRDTNLGIRSQIKYNSLYGRERGEFRCMWMISMK